jgi:hypothetical protein
VNLTGHFVPNPFQIPVQKNFTNILITLHNIDSMYKGKQDRALSIYNEAIYTASGPVFVTLNGAAKM